VITNLSDQIVAVMSLSNNPLAAFSSSLVPQEVNWMMPNGVMGFAATE
jgi:hypothetical protein